MADPDAPRENGEPEDDEQPSTPFDNPFFLPVLLLAFTVWFGYDGWFNPEMEWVKFNRYGFFVLLALTLWFTWRGIQERRADAEDEAEARRDEADRPPPVS